MIGFRTKADKSSKATALLERPRLAADVIVHEPTEDGAPWVVQFDGQRYVRVGAGMAQILRSADGAHTSADIAGGLGDPWTAELVDHGLLKAHQMSLLSNGEQEIKKKRVQWFKYAPPLTLQFTLLNPDPLLKAIRPLLGRLATRGWAATMFAVIAAGLVGLAAQAADIRHTLSTPLSVTVFLSFFLIAWAGTVLHEMAHGAVLSHYGGRPSRMGMMLFYLTPAFFCDVSDGWRLPRSNQRVRIAMAGIATQATLGGLSVIAALLTSGTIHQILLLSAIGGYLAGVFNLMPFIKLDGYLALMSHLDISHLRDRSMTDGRRLIANILFGGRYVREIPQLSWSPWFGLACMLFPVYVVAMAFSLWQSMLSGLGIVGLTLASFVLAYLMLRAYASADRLIREAHAAGARTWRIVLVSALVVGAIGAVLQTVSVPYTVAGGFVRDGDQIMFVVVDNADRSAIEQGATVRLQQSGILLHSETGRALIASQTPRKMSVPLSVFVPVTGADDLKIPALGVPLTTQSLPDNTTGPAQVQAGDRKLSEWLYLRYVAPFWR